MKRLNLIPLFFITVFAFSCKKDNNSVTALTLSGENSIISFNISTELGAPIIDQFAHTVKVIVPSTVNRANMSFTMSISANAVTSIGGYTNGGTVTGNFVNPTAFSITAANGNAVTWSLTVSTDMEYYGLGTNVTAGKSINKSFEYYYDQGNSGTYSSINCGPAVSTMAVKWADSTFSRTVEQARITIPASNGWWYTTDVTNYLKMYSVNSAITSLPDNYQTMQKYLDKGYIMILCLDNFYLKYNGLATQRINKFYLVGSQGSGHFIVVKGYKIVDNKVYFESYDPWSLGLTYALDGTLKGKNRYYTSDELETATGVWWDYAIIVAPKGKTVTLSGGNGLKVQSIDKIPAQKGA